MTWKRINVSKEVYDAIRKEKLNIENATKRDVSFNDVMKILLGHEKKIYIVQQKRRRTILLEEMKPVIHL